MQLNRLGDKEVETSCVGVTQFCFEKSLAVKRKTQTSKNKNFKDRKEDVPEQTSEVCGFHLPKKHVKNSIKDLDPPPVTYETQ